MSKYHNTKSKNKSKIIQKSNKIKKAGSPTNFSKRYFNEINSQSLKSYKELKFVNQIKIKRFLSNKIYDNFPEIKTKILSNIDKYSFEKLVKIKNYLYYINDSNNLFYLSNLYDLLDLKNPLVENNVPYY